MLFLHCAALVRTSNPPSSKSGNDTRLTAFGGNPIGSRRRQKSAIAVMIEDRDSLRSFPKASRFVTTSRPSPPRLIDEALWKKVWRVLPLPKYRQRRYAGRKPLDNRAVLNGILYVLENGIPWDALPAVFEFGTGMTCWNRLMQWKATGVWEPLQQLLQRELSHADQIDWQRADQVGKAHPHRSRQHTKSSQ